MIEVCGLYRHFENGLVRAVDGVDLKIGDGEIVSLMGPSGSGKSTLLNLIGLLDKPDRGEIRVDGKPIAEFRPDWRYRREQVGILFQSHHLLPRLSVLDNVALPLMPSRRPRAEKKRKAMQIIERIGLSGRAGFRANQLSGGERQRAALARALVNQPRILLADEPTGSLDSHSGAETIELIVSISRDRGMTTLLVTHDQNVAARGDRILFMKDGRLACSMSTTESDERASGYPAEADGKDRFTDPDQSKEVGALC